MARINIKHQIDIQDNGNRQNQHWKHRQILIKFQNDSNEHLSTKQKKKMNEQTLMTGGSECSQYSHGRQNGKKNKMKEGEQTWPSSENP